MIKEIIQGASYQWTESPCNYLPSLGWSMTIYFRGAGTGLNLDATVTSDDRFSLSLSSEQTAAFAAGIYAWQSFVIKNSQKIFTGEGNLSVRKGLASIDEDQSYDGRSQYKIALDAIDAMLKNKASLDQQKYVIGNRQLDRIPIPDLLQLRKEYQRLYNQELRSEGAKNGSNGLFKPYRVRFRRP